MPVQPMTDTRHWARSTQRTKQNPRAPVRGVLQLALAEPGSRQPFTQIPPGLAERIREQKILTTPGVAEGFDHANKVIEDWKKSL